MEKQNKVKKIKIPYEIFKFNLTNEGIQEAVSAYESFAEKYDIDTKEMMIGSISFDAVLHEIKNHYGELKEVTFICGKRFGKVYATLRYKGENFDPLVHENDADTFISSSRLLQEYDLSPTYSFKSGMCQIDFPFSPKEKNTLLSLAIAVVLAIIAGNIGLRLPAAIMDTCLLIMNTVESAVFTLITMAAGPLIFLAVIAGISNVGDIKNIGTSGRKLINHILIATSIYGIVTFIIAYGLFPLKIVNKRENASLLENIIDTLVTLIPENVVSPFINGEFQKIVVIAILIGFAMLLIGNSTNNFSDICNSLYTVFTKMFTWFTKFIPVALFTMMTKCILDGSFIRLMNAWKVVVLMVSICTVGFCVSLIYASKKHKRPIGYLFKCCIKCMMIGFSTASSCCAIAKEKEVCVDELGSDENICSFLIPINTIFYGPGQGVNFILLIIFFCNANAYELSVSSLIMIILLSCLFSIIAPPVAGGGVAAFAIIISSTGLPQNIIGLSMIFVILLDYVVTGFKVGEVVLASSLYSQKR